MRGILIKHPAPGRVFYKKPSASIAEPSGWASPDVNGVEFHPLPLRTVNESGAEWREFMVPQLKYWDTILLSR